MESFDSRSPTTNPPPWHQRKAGLSPAGPVDSALDNGSDRDTTPVRRRQQTPGAAKLADLLAADGLAREWGYEAQKQPRLSVESAGTQPGRHSLAGHRRDPPAYGI